MMFIKYEPYVRLIALVRSSFAIMKRVGLPILVFTQFTVMPLEGTDPLYTKVVQTFPSSFYCLDKLGKIIR